MILRAYKICSIAKYRKEELDYIMGTFTTINAYPKHVVYKAMDKIDNGLLNNINVDTIKKRQKAVSITI